MERKSKKNIGPKVCLLSTHPLLLDQFTRRLSQSHFNVKAFRLRQVLYEDVNRLAIPGADVYVVDGHDPFSPTLARALVTRFPNSNVIVLAENFTDSTTFPFLEVGVKGILHYSEAFEHLPEALRTVAGGGYWVERRVLSRFVDSMIHNSRGQIAHAPAARFSPREREVLDCLMENLSNKEIARKLKISERTAKFHVSNLLIKFEVKRRVDLIMLLLQDDRS
ncbi:MAG TPA: response regulator transcription factor [Terriglobia bacterium]|nr:response regulator transcription factor [Terriglobia bacterium]